MSEAHKLAAEINEEQASNVMAYWEDCDSSKLEEANMLIRLGDSKALAVATVMTEKSNDPEDYRTAYHS